MNILPINTVAHVDNSDEHSYTAAEKGTSDFLQVYKKHLSSTNETNGRQDAAHSPSRHATSADKNSIVQAEHSPSQNEQDINGVDTSTSAAEKQNTATKIVAGSQQEVAAGGNKSAKNTSRGNSASRANSEDSVNKSNKNDTYAANTPVAGGSNDEANIDDAGQQASAGQDDLDQLMSFFNKADNTLTSLTSTSESSTNTADVSDTDDKSTDAQHKQYVQAAANKGAEGIEKEAVSAQVAEEQEGNVTSSLSSQSTTQEGGSAKLQQQPSLAQDSKVANNTVDNSEQKSISNTEKVAQSIDSTSVKQSSSVDETAKSEQGSSTAATANKINIAARSEANSEIKSAIASESNVGNSTNVNVETSSEHRLKNVEGTKESKAAKATANQGSSAQGVVSSNFPKKAINTAGADSQSGSNQVQKSQNIVNQNVVSQDVRNQSVSNQDVKGQDALNFESNESKAQKSTIAGTVKTSTTQESTTEIKNNSNQTAAQSSVNNNTVVSGNAGSTINSTTSNTISNTNAAAEHASIEKIIADQAGVEKAIAAQAHSEKALLEKSDSVENSVEKVNSDAKNPQVNASFTDITAKATQVTQHLIDQQAADYFSPAGATEVAQAQKSNAQLHQETISIFRKDFADEVKNRVMVMISQKLQQFDIILDPPELGNMQVRVNLQNEQAAVSFIVQNPQTKDALEQNMHKLRDMLAEQGVDVGDTNIEQQSQQSNNEDSNTDSSNGSKNQREDSLAQSDDLIEQSLSFTARESSSNAVDYYA